VTQPEISDYIGSARFPLKEIGENATEMEMPIINEKNMTMGKVVIKLSFYN